jgi:sarcosine oxidase subunit gamma
MTAPFRTSPLAHRPPLEAGADARIAEASFRGLAILRGEAAQLGAPVREALDLELPAAVGQTATGTEAAALWLGPDEWLLELPEETAAETITRLGPRFAGLHHQLVEVSDQMAVIELAGERARDLLAKLMVIDLHPRAFPEGRSVATVLGHAAVWLWLKSGGTFRLYVRCSFADYVWCLLAEAGREWGLPAQDPAGQVKLHLPHFEG